MFNKLTKEKKIEIAFLTVFSTIIVVLFYSLISMNGLVLGNDPAVHLSKAEVFLQTGQIPLANIGWIPPLFEILLAMTISLSGVNNIGQMVFLLKALAVVIDWLLFLSIYFVGSKFFNRKVGALAAAFLAMCYPMYELNTWGGYTTALGIAFLLLLFYYSYLVIKQVGYIVVVFVVAFAIFLAHQLTAFLAAIIMLPIMLMMLIKFKRAYLKGFLAIIVGGIVAFLAFYYPAIANYLDAALYHIFFGNKAYVVDIPLASLQSFLMYFGFILFLAIGGVAVSYNLLKRQKKMILFVTLMLSLFVPLFFAESYLFGFLLPFEWFTYYVAPPVMIFGAVCTIAIAEKLSVYFKNNKSIARKKWLKISAIVLIVVACGSLVVFQVNYTYEKIMFAGSFNSTADKNAYDAAVWLGQNYPDAGAVVVPINPGDWFSVISGKRVIAQTYDWEGANPVADSVIKFDYEIQTPQNLVKAYESNCNITDENYVYLDDFWNRLTYSSISADSLSFNQNNTSFNFALADLTRTTSFYNQSGIKAIEINYFNAQVALTQTIRIQNSSYPINISWSLMPLNSSISDVVLHLTTYFDLKFRFDKAQIPQLMNCTNPWDMPSKNTNGNLWATVDFSSSDLADHYLGLFDKQDQTAFAFNFTDVPDSGNIGALTDRQIDAVRYQFNVNQIDVNQTVTRQYQILTLSKNSYPSLQPDQIQNLFQSKPDQFAVSTHSYQEYIAQNNIEFIVYNKNYFDPYTSLPLSSSFLPQISQSQFLKLIYKNNEYDIFRVLNNYNQTHVWN